MGFRGRALLFLVFVAAGCVVSTGAFAQEKPGQAGDQKRKDAKVETGTEGRRPPAPAAAPAGAMRKPVQQPARSDPKGGEAAGDPAAELAHLSKPGGDTNVVTVTDEAVGTMAKKLEAFGALLTPEERMIMDWLLQRAAAAPADDPSGTSIDGFLFTPPVVSAEAAGAGGAREPAGPEQTLEISPSPKAALARALGMRIAGVTHPEPAGEPAAAPTVEPSDETAGAAREQPGQAAQPAEPAPPEPATPTPPPAPAEPTAPTTPSAPAEPTAPTSPPAPDAPVAPDPPAAPSADPGDPAAPDSVPVPSAPAAAPTDSVSTTTPVPEDALGP